MHRYKTHFQRSSRLIILASQIDSSEAEFTKSNVVQLACVVANAAIETCVQECLMQYCRNRTGSEVARFLDGHIRRFQNPKFNKIMDLMGSFSKNWKDDIISRTSDQVVAAIDSIVNNRNRIAHGESVDLSLASARNWIKLSENFCDTLNEVVNGKSLN